MSRIFVLVLLFFHASLFAAELSFGPPRPATPKEATLVPQFVAHQPVFVVPVFLTGASGDALGTDRGQGSRVQALSIDVQFAPLHLVWGIAFQQAGVTTGLKPIFENRTRNADTAGWMALFDERRTPLDLVPGRMLVAELVMTAPPDIRDQQITLAFRPAPTAIGNQAGTIVQTKDHGLTLNNITFAMPR